MSAFLKINFKNISSSFHITEASLHIHFTFVSLAIHGVGGSNILPFARVITSKFYAENELTSLSHRIKHGWRHDVVCVT